MFLFYACLLVVAVFLGFLIVVVVVVVVVVCLFVDCLLLFSSSFVVVVVAFLLLLFDCSLSLLLLIRTKHNTRIFGVISFIKLQNYFKCRFVGLIKGTAPNIPMFCFVLIHSVLF